MSICIDYATEMMHWVSQTKTGWGLVAYAIEINVKREHKCYSHTTKSANGSVKCPPAIYKMV